MNRLSISSVIEIARGILDYQFDPYFSDIFFDLDQSLLSFSFSHKTGKIKYIYYNNELQASYRPFLGTFTLTLAVGNRILSKLSFPKYRIIVQNDVSPFIEDGKSVFCKHVVDLDHNLHLGDEVFVVNENDKFLAVGKLDKPSHYIKNFNSGTAVNVRKGINSLKTKK